VQRTLWWGAVVGTLIGVVVALLLGLVVIGTNDIRGFADAEDLPGLYVIAALIGAFVGAVTGAAGLLVAVLVARASAGSPANRRLRGALAAAGCSALVSMFTMGALFFGPGLFAVIVVGALGGVAAWLLLPSQLDLSAAPRPIITPAQPSADPGEGMSALNRGVITIVVAGGGSFLVTNIVMTIIASVAHVKRDVADVVALVILGIAFVVIAVTLWRYLARRRPVDRATKP
jgi:hypothetical protein